MKQLHIYLAIAVISAAVIIFLLFLRNKNSKNKNLSPLVSAGFGFVLAGIIFGENRLIGYSLLGVGAILSVADICIKRNK